MQRRGSVLLFCLEESLSMSDRNLSQIRTLCILLSLIDAITTSMKEKERSTKEKEFGPEQKFSPEHSQSPSIRNMS
jgi:hypothetical protein